MTGIPNQFGDIDPIVPNFGVAPAAAATPVAESESGDAQASPAAAVTPVSTPVAAGPRKICFICSKGNLDMAYPALIMGNAALGEGIEVDIFFTFWGYDLIDKRYMNKLKFTMAGNTAMHLPMAPAIPMPQLLGVLPGMTTASTKMMNKMLADEEIPPVGEFMDLLKAMGARLWACRLTFDMMKLRESDLRDDLDGIISASDFIEKAEGAQIIFI